MRMKTVRYLFVLALLLMTVSCTTTRYVPVVEHHTDTLRLSRNIRDSIYVHDSTMVREKGDTVLVERWHTRYREKLAHDTIYKSRVDSIPAPYPVEKKVEKELTWWQQTRLHLANIVLWLLGAAAVWWIGGVIRKRYMP
jgi:hypothetical protein